MAKPENNGRPPVAAKQAAEPSLKELADNATTANEHQQVKAALQRRLAAARQRADALETGREAAALEGRSEQASRERMAAADSIADLLAAIAAAEQRRNAAETAEIEQAMRDGAKAAHAKAPELAALFQRVFGEQEQVIETWKAIGETVAAMNDLQAHALRRAKEPGGQRDLACNPVHVRAEAVAALPRPHLGPEAPGPLSLHDGLAVLSMQLVEVVNRHGVHADDAFAARRTGVLVDIRPRKTADGAAVVDPTSMAGRGRGGHNRGVA